MNYPVAEIKNLSFSYGEIRVLENLNFSIAGNQYVSIVGPNGAGKSTLIKILLGLLKVSQGDVKIFSKEPSNVEPDLVGYVPQIKTMDRNFPCKVSELVTSGLTARWPWSVKGQIKDQAVEALKLVKAEKLSNRILSELSGGELQRVCLARSFVKKPKLVILDEPATGIDAVGESDLYNLLDNYRTKTEASIIMITHDWHVAHHHSDLVLLLNRKQVSFGKPEEALSEQNLRTAFGHIGHKHQLSVKQL